MVDALHLLFDVHGLQVRAEEQTHERLSGPGGVYETLQQAGHTYRSGPLDDLTSTDVLVLTTRGHLPYTYEELERIAAFVQAGGGLLCASNHGPFRAHLPNSNLVRFDNAVANTFGASFEPSINYRLGTQIPMELPVGTPFNQHATTVVCNNSCGILPARGVQTVVPIIGEGIGNRADRQAVTEGLAWASTIVGGLAGEGRVLLVADSGWLGREGSTLPGPGQFHLGDNAAFFLAAVHWLGQRGEDATS